jgi:hypothetical protein
MLKRLFLLLVALPVWAADPVVESSTGSNDIAPADATLDITLDNADNSGDLLVMAVCTHPDVDPFTPPSGWTEMDDYNRSAGTHSAWLGYKSASGSEGASATLTASGTPDVWAANVIRVSNWDSGTNPEDNNYTNIVGTTSTPDPQSITQSWGADDNLFITFICHTDDAATVSSAPSGWTLAVDETGNGGANESAQMSSATLLDNSSTTVDPGTWTLSTAEAVSDVTVAVLGGAGAGSIVPITVNQARRRRQ